MSRVRRFLLPAVILLAASAIAAVVVSLRPEPEPRESGPRIPLVTTSPAVAGSGPIPVFGAGTVRPRVEVDVAAGVSGRVVRVDPAFESGGRVSEGQVLFRIDDADYRYRIERARAGVAVREVELLRVEEEARIARARREDLPGARAEVGRAADAGPLAGWGPQLEAARATLAEARAVVAEAELHLSRTAVLAPFDAVVRSESVGVGQFVTAGVGVGRIYASDAVEVVVPVSDADAALIPGLWELRAGTADRGVAVRVTADHAARAWAWSGYVDRVEAALKEDTRTIELIVRVPDPMTSGRPADDVGSEADPGWPSASAPPPLLAGRFVEVEIAGIAPPEYFRIRRLALRPGNEVWAVREGAVTIVPVRVLQRFDGTAWVTGGLRDGEELVMTGIRFATGGMRVRAASSRGR